MNANAFSTAGKPDWFDELNYDQKSDILEGITQADLGKIIPHDEVVKLFANYGLE
ncbi:hypothetical protein [Mucilaginibacter sp. OK283]|jgi:predicted transcriptional regulator|uniref:hypothetical protein n=1 Tax=Mucilaginibacter sp. OK283 TaxID=1881049 RepID=UPI0008C68CC4|nr:hypothetical protein [Mucilaginibacter sp. OK283]SEO40484.1 hypothetical protein SAMN05428947_102250 [Mucilaginibacter sp. OK283]